MSTLSFACATATGAVRVSPPESLTSSWNGPEVPGAFSHHGPSVVPREPPHQDGVPDQASQRGMQHGRQQGMSLGSKSPSPAQSQEIPQPKIADAGNGNNSRPDSAVYKAKVKLDGGSCVIFNHVFFEPCGATFAAYTLPNHKGTAQKQSWQGLACTIHCHQLMLHPSSSLSGRQL